MSSAALVFDQDAIEVWDRVYPPASTLGDEDQRGERPVRAQVTIGLLSDLSATAWTEEELTFSPREDLHSLISTRERELTLKRLSELARLPRDWDSYGAERIPSEVVAYAMNLILLIVESSVPAPSIVPTSRGGIQLEWHRQGIDLEICIDGPGDISFSAEDLNTGEVDSGRLSESPEVSQKWLARISR